MRSCLTIPDGLISEELIDAADQPLGEDEMRAMWLRKVETRPADFLAIRFNYQLATKEKDSSENKKDDEAAIADE